MDAPELSLYDILGVAHNSSQEDIHRAFRIVAKQHHPDAGGSREMFEGIKHAYEILSDESERKRYDAARRILEQVENDSERPYDDNTPSWGYSPTAAASISLGGSINMQMPPFFAGSSIQFTRPASAIGIRMMGYATS